MIAALAGRTSEGDACGGAWLVSRNWTLPTAEESWLCNGSPGIEQLRTPGKRHTNGMKTTVLLGLLSAILIVSGRAIASFSYFFSEKARSASPHQINRPEFAHFCQKTSGRRGTHIRGSTTSAEH